MSDKFTVRPDNKLSQNDIFPPPDRVIEDSRYHVRFASTWAEVDAALKLRFEVFNLELAEGLASSFDTQRDQDKYDKHCHHLLVVENDTGATIGTYRMQTAEMASQGEGFYSDDEFEFEKLDREMLAQGVEVGRACIAQEHRNGRVLFLLWQGLAEYMSVMGKRYLFGCCSLTSQDPDEGKLVMELLTKKGQITEGNLIPARPAYQCYDETYVVRNPRSTKLPRLFRTYLSYGAKVYSLPALDRQFKTIDYLVVLDIDQLDRRTRQMFFR